MFKLRSSRYLIKLVLFGVAVCTVPVIIFGALSFINASGRIEDKVVNENMQVLQQTQMRMEQALRTLDSSMTQFSMSTHVYNALQQTVTPQDYLEANTLLEGMQRLQSFDLPAQNVYLISLEHHWLLHNSGMAQWGDQTFMNDIYELLGNPKSSYWSASRLNGLYGMQTASLPDFNLNMVKKLPVYSAQPKGLMIAQLSPYALNELLSQNGESGEIVIMDEYGKVIAHKDEAMVGKPMSALPYADAAKLTDSAVQTGHYASADKKNKEILFRKSGYNGWTYLSVVPLEEISRDSRDMGKILLMNGFIILAFMIVIVYQGSRGMYNPIRRLYEMSSGDRKPGKEQPAGDEIRMIEERIVSFQRTHDLMAEQLHDNREQLKQLFVLKLFQGAMPPEEINEKCESFGFAPVWSWMSVLTLQVDAPDESEGAGAHPYDDAAAVAVQALIHELIPDHLRLSPALHNETPTVLIGMHQPSLETFRQFLSQMAVLIQEEMKRHLRISVSIGISRPYSDIGHTRHACDESREALKYRIRLGRESILFIEDVQPSRRHNPIVPKQMENELIEAVQLGETERAVRLCSRFIQEMFAKEMFHREYQTMLLHLLTELLRVVHGSEEQSQNVFHDEASLFDHIFELTTAKEIEAWFNREVIVPASQAMERGRAVQYKSISDKVIELIHRDYDQDLSLELCADALNYHPSYVKQVFRKETGMNFSDYVTNYRMNMAKRWLLETDWKISDIAEKLRYTNSQNFIRSFRKTVGVTPGQYRQSASAGAE